MPLKIVVSGGLGAGKTTFVGTISEIPPLTTEEYMTARGEAVDNLDGIQALKETTTVALDFGRRTFRGALPLELFLFGTPGQDRFVPLWRDIAEGAVGAVVLVDTSRLGQSFTAVSFFEHLRMPFVVALNRFDGAHHHATDDVRDALALSADIPVVSFDARQPDQVASVLLTLAGHALTRHGLTNSPPAPATF
ncbi:GTP-binding protein [Streptomyces seoulensis]|uniref:GTP-binding protein n=1 Tax=Streptomyces seoulensis TaxID=73044 RepID=UPI001FCB660A|nr:ATP/GTP-binding protein [Streptomyces seoulensis]BDH07145.1 ATP-binding protein [Streptomyces seoulensis]